MLGLRSIKGLRWWIIALVCLGTLLNYLARNALGVLAPQLKIALKFSTQDYSYVVAAFQLAYTLMLPIGGLVIDRCGLRLGVALFAGIWGIANMLHALAGGWASLAACRALLGLGEAAAIPSGVRAANDWFPAKERSVAIGDFGVGTSIGAGLAPPLAAGLALRFGWRAVVTERGMNLRALLSSPGCRSWPLILEGSPPDICRRSWFGVWPCRGPPPEWPGAALGAALMMGPGLVGLAKGPVGAIGLFCIGGFAHQMITTMINTLSTDPFPREAVASANGLAGMAGWAGGLMFSLTVGALADRIGYSPLFICHSGFDLVGALALVLLLGSSGRSQTQGR